MASAKPSPRSSRGRSSRLDIGALLDVDRVTESLESAIATGGGQGMVAVVTVRPDISGMLHKSDDADFISWAGEFEQRLGAADERLRLAFRSAEEAIGFVPDLTSRREIDPLVARLAAALDGPMSLGDHDIAVDSRAGVAVVDASNPSLDDVVEAADLALRRTSPNHRARSFCPFQRRQKLHRDQLVTRIRDDLRAGALMVRYQPMIDLRTGRLRGVEALARLRDGDRGELSPGVFLPVAARHGLMGAVGNGVLARVAQDLGRWRTHVREPITVWINVSVREALDPRTLASVDPLIDPSSPLGVGVELTETARASSDDLGRALQTLASRHVAIAVEHDRIALTDIARHPIDTVKLGRRAIRHLSARADEATPALVTMLHSIGVTVTAEGLETEGHLRPAVDAGCDLGQGFYFARPAEAAAIDRALTHTGEPAQAGVQRSTSSSAR
ncbi:MAG: EAL domain-containing protein, partial [Acidimicrobiia bacterium]|nr:EAL domain-containing protein [Acidimicrobiia bacterium]